MRYESPTVELLGDNEMNKVQGEWAVYPVAAFPVVVAAVAYAVVYAAIYTVVWYKVATVKR